MHFFLKCSKVRDFWNVIVNCLERLSEINLKNMYYLVQLVSINTDLPFKSPILKLILADDFVFTDGFLPFLAFLISSSLVFKTCFFLIF